MVEALIIVKDGGTTSFLPFFVVLCVVFIYVTYAIYS